MSNPARRNRKAKAKRRNDYELNRQKCIVNMKNRADMFWRQFVTESGQKHAALKDKQLAEAIIDQILNQQLTATIFREGIDSTRLSVEYRRPSGNMFIDHLRGLAKELRHPAEPQVRDFVHLREMVYSDTMFTNPLQYRSRDEQMNHINHMARNLGERIARAIIIQVINDGLNLRRELS